MWVSHIERFNEVDPRIFTTSFPWEVPDIEGDHTVYLRVEDMAGNLADVHASIHFATKQPLLTLLLPGGPMSNSTTHILLNVSSVDPYGEVEVQVLMDSDPQGDGPWQNANKLAQVIVPGDADDGPHEIRVIARNAAGILSEVTIIPVMLDRTPPTVSVQRPVDGSAIPQKGLEVLLRLEAFDPSGIAGVRYKVGDDEWRSTPRTNLSAVVVLADFGEHTIWVEVTDGTGNVGRNSTTFVLEDSAAAVSDEGSSWTLLLVIIVVAVVGGLLFGFNKLRTSKPTPAPQPEIAQGPQEQAEAQEQAPAAQPPHPEPQVQAVEPMPSAESPQPVQPTTPAQPAPEEHPKASDWEEF